MPNLVARLSFLSRLGFVLKKVLCKSRKCGLRLEHLEIRFGLEAFYARIENELCDRHTLRYMPHTGVREILLVATRTADILRTSFGPAARSKLIQRESGDVFMSCDGASILREVPASVLRTQADDLRGT